MLRMQHGGAFLLLEGSTDTQVFTNLVVLAACKIVSCGGKPNALEASSILVSRGVNGVLTIVDADFSRLAGQTVRKSHVLLTDTHDIETMLLESPAFDKVLREYGSSEKCDSLKCSVRDLLLDSGACLGYLRWSSRQHDMKLTFSGIAFKRFVERDDLSIKVDAMIRVVVLNSGQQGLTDIEIAEKSDELRDPSHDLWQVCCGRDLIELLSIGLLRCLATRELREVGPTSLEKALRLAFEPRFFEAFPLCDAIRQWEKSNAPYQVLP
jgi:hypothetical protein